MRQPDKQTTIRRLRMLRNLDLLLLTELGRLGATAASSFVEHAVELMHRRRLAVSTATIEDWWIYALRRELLVRHPDDSLVGEYALSPRGRDHLRQQAVLAADPRAIASLRSARWLLKLLLPTSGVLSLLIAAASHDDAARLVALFSALGGALLGAVVVAGFMRLAAPATDRLDRWALRAVVERLEGRQARWALLGRSALELPRAD